MRVLNKTRTLHYKIKSQLSSIKVNYKSTQDGPIARTHKPHMSVNKQSVTCQANFRAVTDWSDLQHHICEYKIWVQRLPPATKATLWSLLSDTLDQHTMSLSSLVTVVNMNYSVITHGQDLQKEWNLSILLTLDWPHGPFSWTFKWGRISLL